jgi:hypothetical protein
MDEAAQFFCILTVKEQRKFYDMMHDFMNPENNMARERVLHWLNQYVAQICSTSIRKISDDHM